MTSVKIELKPVAGRPRPRRWIFIFAAAATVVALFYAEENWRGRRDLEAYRAELLAKGEKLNWKDYVKPSIPDDQNFLKVPLMDAWFNKATPKSETNRVIRHPGWLVDIPPLIAELRNWDLLPATGRRLGNRGGDPLRSIESRAATPAAELLRWYAKYKSEFAELSVAAERPHARLDGASDSPWSEHGLNYVSLRTVSQNLAIRAKANLVCGRPDAAIQDLRLLRRIMDLHEAQPPTLVSAMIRVALGGLYMEIVEDGWQNGYWRETDWISIADQLRSVNFLEDLADSFRGGERAGIVEVFDHFDRASMANLFDFEKKRKWPIWTTPRGFYIYFAPRGWLCQNELFGLKAYQGMLDEFDTGGERVSPGRWEREMDQIWSSVERKAVYNEIVQIYLPNFRKATMAVVERQTTVNQVRIVSALERFKTATGQYPESLDLLVPRYLDKIPHDLIGGQPLKFSRTKDGRFLLYSVGWDEKDDFGVPDRDWVWGEHPSR